MYKLPFFSPVNSDCIGLSGKPRNLFSNKGPGDFYLQTNFGTTTIVDRDSPAKFLITNFLVTDPICLL